MSNEPTDFEKLNTKEGESGEKEIPLDDKAAEFLREQMKNAGPASENEAAPEPEKVKVKQDKATGDEAMAEADRYYHPEKALPRIQTELSEDEKAAALNTIMFDQPLELETKAFGGNFRGRFRSITAHEFYLVYKAAHADIIQSETPDMGIFITRLQQYKAAISTLSLNDKSFERVDLSPETPEDEATEKLKKLASSRVFGVQQPRWLAWLTCLRVFSEKERICYEQVFNSDFWTPAG